MKILWALLTVFAMILATFLVGTIAVWLVTNPVRLAVGVAVIALWKFRHFGEKKKGKHAV